MSHIYRDGDVGCSRIKQWMSEGNNEVSAEEKVKMKITTTGNIHRIQNRIEMKVQIGELNE